MGRAALLFASLGFMNVLFSYGMDVAFLRYFILEETREGRARYFSTAFLTILSTGLGFSALIFFSPALVSRIIFRTPEYFGLVRLASGILLADALCLLPFLVLRAEQRPVRFAGLKFLNVLANLGMSIYLVAIQGKGLTGVFTANLSASFFTLLTVLPLILSWLRPIFNRSTLGNLLRFGLPYIPSLFSVLIMDQISRFFIDRMINEEATGVFSANYKLGMFMALVTAAFRFAWHPFFLSTLKEEGAPRIFARILTYFIAVTGTLFLVISFYINEIVHISVKGVTLLDPRYYSGLPIVPVVMLAYIGYGVYVNFIIGVYLKKKTQFLPLVTGAGALVSLAANYFLIPSLGIMGAAWATVLAYTTMAVVLFLYSRRLYDIPYEWGRVVKLVIIFTGLFLLGTGVFHPVSPLVRLLIIFSLPLFLLLSKFFSEDEKAVLSRMCRRR